MEKGSILSPYLSLDTTFNYGAYLISSSDISAFFVLTCLIAKKYFQSIPNYPSCPMAEITSKCVLLRSVIGEANDLMWKFLTQMFRLPKPKETILRYN